MFGGQKVFLLDVFIIITGAYVSSITMIIVALSIEALANSYMEFNKEIEENIKSGKLQTNAALLEEIEGSLIEYLRLADVVYRCFGAAISMTFMNGLIVHSSAQFALRVYGENMNLLQMSVYMGWALLGFVTTAAPLNRHRTFYKVVIFLMMLLAFCQYLLLYTRLYEG
uniref:Uncharacterized protein n=1 Tax=Acrobeloides nanus TaxID=290746 RepID=A0A914CAD9_9BILA